ncbi:MAG: hypothetical protein NZV14_15655 [Bryobacteraceae bacterium]|nr:hypothetical protein [Bryobacteraceae bacterium]MDW8379597.1 hypothetical protein [Bryobacterales bacterium]
MSKPSSVIDVVCPCCQAALRVDARTGAVLAHKEKESPKGFESFEAAVKNLQAEAGRREAAFQKSLSEYKSQKEILEKKFDELFQRAKEDPSGPAPRHPFEFD